MTFLLITNGVIERNDSIIADFSKSWQDSRGQNTSILLQKVTFLQKLLK